MKRLIVVFLSWTGALALLGAAFALLINLVAPDYDKRAKEEFGSTEAIRAIEELYARIEKTPTDPELTPLKSLYRFHAYHTVRRIPKSWLPAEFSDWGAILNSELIENTDVFAYYDSNNALLAIEFSGTRYGCFVSRDPNRVPPQFNMLQRLAEKPLFITSRIGLSPAPEAD